jgi:hypothetical protein
MLLNVDDIVALIRSYINYVRPGSTTHLDLSNSELELRQAAMNCFYSWAIYCQSELMNHPEVLQALRSLTPLALINVVQEVDGADQVITDLLDLGSRFLSAPDSRAYFYEMIQNPWMDNRLTGLSDFDPTAISAARLIIMFAELEAESLVQSPSSTQSQALFSKSRVMLCNHVHLSVFPNLTF